MELGLLNWRHLTWDGLAWRPVTSHFFQVVISRGHGRPNAFQTLLLLHVLLYLEQLAEQNFVLVVNLTLSFPLLKAQRYQLLLHAVAGRTAFPAQHCLILTAMSFSALNLGFNGNSAAGHRTLGQWFLEFWRQERVECVVVKHHVLRYDLTVRGWSTDGRLWLTLNHLRAAWTVLATVLQDRIHEAFLVDKRAAESCCVGGLDYVRLLLYVLRKDSWCIF